MRLPPLTTPQNEGRARESPKAQSRASCVGKRRAQHAAQPRATERRALRNQKRKRRTTIFRGRARELRTSTYNNYHPSSGNHSERSVATRGLLFVTEYRHTCQITIIYTLSNIRSKSPYIHSIRVIFDYYKVFMQIVFKHQLTNTLLYHIE